MGVSYVGQSQSLARRLRAGHEILYELRRDHFVRQWFKCFPENLLRDTERELIKFYDPPFNIIGRRRGFYK